MYIHKLSAMFTSYKDIVIYLLPLLYLVIVIIYRYLRRKFPVQVNCWFCNKNTSVEYHSWNSFTCPSCKQYNGFTKEGDYNKPIPEQQDELLNHIVSPRKYQSGASSNGLCILCNNNQQLKIYQLRNFVPLNEDDYDIEIEHFQKQLEKAYKLCPQCNLTVKDTIAKQNRSLIGKQIEEIRKSGRTLLNQSTTAKLNQIRLRWFIMFSIPCTTMAAYYLPQWYNMYELWTLLITCIHEHSKELSFAVGGSFCTWLSMYLLKTNSTTSPVLRNKITKQERKLKLRKSTESHEEYTGDISYSSFNSPLNSTIRSDDEQSFYSELELLSSNPPPSIHSIKPSSISSLPNQSVFNDSHRQPSSPSRTFTCQSPTLALYSLNTAKGPFSNTSQLDLTLGQLYLNNEQKRPILLPAKFRNPWTGKLWHADAPSRSSSQSSGIYSRATSICGDEVASLTFDNNLLNNVSNRLETYSMNIKSPLHNSFGMQHDR